MDITHTFTPTKMRGKGLAGLVVKHVLEYCKGNNLKVCSFDDYPRAATLPLVVERCMPCLSRFSPLILSLAPYWYLHCSADQYRYPEF